MKQTCIKDLGHLVIDQPSLAMLYQRFDLNDYTVSRMTFTTERAARGWRLGQRQLKGATAALLLYKLGIWDLNDDDPKII